MSDEKDKILTDHYDSRMEHLHNYTVLVEWEYYTYSEDYAPDSKKVVTRLRCSAPGCDSEVER